MNSYNELPKTYSPGDFEDKIYANWCEKGYFTPTIDHNKPSFTIVIPLQTSQDNCTWVTPWTIPCRIF